MAAVMKTSEQQERRMSQRRMMQGRLRSEVLLFAGPWGRLP